jgi:hypothetical protein
MLEFSEITVRQSRARYGSIIKNERKAQKGSKRAETFFLHRYRLQIKCLSRYKYIANSVHVTK